MKVKINSQSCASLMVIWKSTLQEKFREIKRNIPGNLKLKKKKKRDIPPLTTITLSPMQI